MANKLSIPHGHFCIIVRSNDTTSKDIKYVPITRLIKSNK